MKRDPTPKHKTPNYRLVAHGVTGGLMLPPPYVKKTWVAWTWEPVPLRADRRDL